jgi:hypothetical protein
MLVLLTGSFVLLQLDAGDWYLISKDVRFKWFHGIVVDHVEGGPRRFSFNFRLQDCTIDEALEFAVHFDYMNAADADVYVHE